MSRIGNRILEIPSGVEAIVNNSKIEVKGVKGSLTLECSPLINVKVDKDGIATIRANEEKHTKQLHGTTNALILSMIEGVSKGYKKEIVIKGVGYKATVTGNKIEVAAGYSHPVILDIIEGVEVSVEKNTNVTIEGIDKQKVGQMAALIRDIRRPSPYSGKGIMYKDEKIRRKEGKGAA